MTYPMPTIPIDRIIDPEAAGFARRITSGPTNRLRATRSKNISGQDQYVWRNVAFYLSRRPAHQCMPVCADFYLEEKDWERRREVCKHLDSIVDLIVDAVPVVERHGVNRWARAFGTN